MTPINPDRIALDMNNDIWDLLAFIPHEYANISLFLITECNLLTLDLSKLIIQIMQIAKRNRDKINKDKSDCMPGGRIICE
jgi:hypothetical protein